MPPKKIFLNILLGGLLSVALIDQPKYKIQAQTTSQNFSNPIQNVFKQLK